MRNRRFPALTLVALAAGGAPAACGAPAPPTLSTPDPAQLLEADRAFAADAAESGVDGWVRWFAPHGAQLIEGGEVRGLEAIRELMTPAFADPSFSLSWEPTYAEIAASGDLGYTLGRYVRRGSDGKGGSLEATGQYFTVWKRGADGEWRVAVDGGVPDPEPDGG